LKSAALLVFCVRIGRERDMFRERSFAKRKTNPERRSPVGPGVFPLALPDGICIAAERRGPVDRRRGTYESPLHLFRDIPPDIVQGLLESCPVREFADEAVVLSPGQANEHIHMLLAGRLRVHLDAIDSANPIVIEVGGCIGELSIIDGKPVSAHVVAERGSRLLIIPQEAFWARILPNPGVARNLLRVLTERMRRNNDAILEGMRQQLLYEHIQKELRVAREIQASMLPGRQPGATDLDICAAMEPAREVGGDLYDFFMLDADRLFFLVGDVSGKGLPASIFMAVSKALCKSAALRRGQSVDALFRQASEDMTRENSESLFVTAFAGVLDVRTGHLEYCSAGHDAPFVFGPSGELVRLSEGGGPPLCVLDGYSYVAASYQLNRESTLCLFTDGVTEAMNAAGELYGTRRLRAAIESARKASSPAALVNAIRADVADYVAGAEPADDLTVLVLRWPGN